ncbi:MAG: ATP-dependent RecD-like DNA helicase [Lachnospiraceae bacterium]|nr:ATP-dependent RecD-like DNA helicase [Lachnospiraceae bacterium]
MILEGTVENIIYRNRENGWTVFELSCRDFRVNVTGLFPILNAGDRARITGTYVSHPKYGRQFKADTMELMPMDDIESIRKYLSSGLIRGIGEATARAITDHFGESTLSVIEDSPERLIEIPGIGRKKAAMISASYAENRAMRSILIALQPFGITLGQAFRIYSVYGDECVDRIREDPYQLIHDVDGIGFVTADRIARNISGFSAESVTRLCAGILFALEQAQTEFGHTYLPKSALLQYAGKLLNVHSCLLEEALDRLLLQKRVFVEEINDETGIFLPYLHGMEDYLARRLTQMKKSVPEHPFIRALTGPSTNEILLSEEQAEAVEACVKQNIFVITGGPGTGKTTVIRYITRMAASMGMDFALAAPTGRASKRMTEATGTEAKTIHRLLEYVPGQGFQKNRDDPLCYDMIIVDEASMMDVPLFYSLLNAIPVGSSLILVGDSDQLPPVGAGNVLKDILESGVIPSIRLKEIYRQARESMIVMNAHRINGGCMPILDVPGSDFYFEEIHASEAVMDRIRSILSNADDPSSLLKTATDVQILAPMKKGSLGVYELNAEMQRFLNPPSPEKIEILSGDTLFRAGDRVMQIKNDYRLNWKKNSEPGIEEGTGVFNGDLGTIIRIDPDRKEVVVSFDDGRTATYDQGSVLELELAYCISIHKSQGSEFSAVILPLTSAPAPLLNRNLLYTAVTRAKKRVICLGRSETLHRMVKNDHVQKRYTALKTRLKEWDTV